MEERYLTRKEAMELLRVSLRTLQRMEKRGQLHPIRVSPRKVLYKESEVKQLLEGGVNGMIIVRAYVLRDLGWEFYEDPTEAPTYVVFDVDNELVYYIDKPHYDFASLRQSINNAAPVGDFKSLGVDQDFITEIKEYDITELP